jgi:hypothetical protein
MSTLLMNFQRNVFIWGSFHLVLLFTETTALSTPLSLPSEEAAELNKEEILIEDGNWK